MRSSSFDSTIIDFRQTNRVEDYSHFTEAYRTTELFLTRIATFSPELTSKTELQSDIARVLTGKSNKSLITFFNAVHVGNPNPYSFFNIWLNSSTLVNIAIDAFNEMYEERQYRDSCKKEFKKLLADTNNRKRLKNKFRIPFTMKDKGHLITQIIFDSHKTTRCKLISIFEGKREMSIFVFLLENYLSGKHDLSWILKTYEDLDTSLIQNMSPAIWDRLLQHLKSQQQSYSIQAFLAWQQINALTKAEFLYPILTFIPI